MKNLTMSALFALAMLGLLWCATNCHAAPINAAPMVDAVSNSDAGQLVLKRHHHGGFGRGFGFGFGFSRFGGFGYPAVAPVALPFAAAGYGINVNQFSAGYAVPQQAFIPQQVYVAPQQSFQSFQMLQYQQQLGGAGYGAGFGLGAGVGACPTQGLGSFGAVDPSAGTCGQGVIVGPNGLMFRRFHH